MAKTLVIKDANFTNNKLDTVTLVEINPCVELTLNKTSASVKWGNTETLVATPVPANTSDSISWASSDETVATVNNGVVTVVGLGTSAITATCGSQSAICTISTFAYMDTNVVSVAEVRLTSNALVDGGTGYGYTDNSSPRGTMLSSVGLYPYGDQLYNSEHVYAYKLPNNTTHLKVTMPSTVDPYRISWNNSETTVVFSGNNYVAQVACTIAPFTVTDNVLQIEVPQYESYPTIDSFVISFVNKDTNVDFDASTFNNITVEFLRIEG